MHCWFYTLRLEWISGIIEKFVCELWILGEKYGLVLFCFESKMLSVETFSLPARRCMFICLLKTFIIRHHWSWYNLFIDPLLCLLFVGLIIITIAIAVVSKSNKSVPSSTEEVDPSTAVSCILRGFFLHIGQGCANQERQVAVATAFCTQGPNICGFSLWNLQHFKIASRILWNVCTIDIGPYNCLRVQCRCTWKFSNYRIYIYIYVIWSSLFCDVARCML
jgi:hypothetical protein